MTTTLSPEKNWIRNNPIDFWEQEMEGGLGNFVKGEYVLVCSNWAFSFEKRPFLEDWNRPNEVIYEDEDVKICRFGDELQNWTLKREISLAMLFRYVKWGFRMEMDLYSNTKGEWSEDDLKRQYEEIKNDLIKSYKKKEERIEWQAKKKELFDQVISDYQFTTLLQHEIQPSDDEKIAIYLSTFNVPKEKRYFFVYSMTRGGEGVGEKVVKRLVLEMSRWDEAEVLMSAGIMES